jgi:hypothetical protein
MREVCTRGPARRAPAPGLLSYLFPQVVFSVNSTTAKAGAGAVRRPGPAALLVIGAAVAAATLLVTTSAGAKTFAPRHHKIFHGVSDTSSNHDFHRFARRVGAHPAVLEDFYHWDTPLTTGALKRWRKTRTRGVLSLSTAPGGGSEMISPRQIAKGKGDHYLVRLNQSIARSGQVVYIRPFPEMNGSWNPYSAYNANGTRKGKSHSTRNFRRAWRRMVMIVRGGKVKKINKRLRKRDMPRVLRARSNHAPTYRRHNIHGRLKHAKVSFVWTPQTIGSPALRGNRPGAYWPGRRYVDWVGADIYSKFATPGIWSAFKHFYHRWRHQPFVVGEYSPWDNDYSGHFTHKLFRWAEHHRRVRMLIYYRSVAPNTIYDINHWPRARKVIRHQLNKHRFAPYAPHVRHRGHHHRHRHRHPGGTAR